MSELTILSNCIVDKIIFNFADGLAAYLRAVGVVFLDAQGTVCTVTAKTRIVLCAGTIGSPAVLLRSGVGPQAELERHHIETVVDLPAVGQHLQDHIWCPVTISSKEPLILDNFQNHVETHLLAQSSFSRAIDGPRDIQIMQANICASTDQIASGEHKRSGFTLVPVFLYARSSGTVSLSSASPLSNPVIDPRYLSDPHDMVVLMEAVTLALEVVQQPAMQEVCGEVLQPCEQVKHPHDLKEFITANANTLYHPVGTCRMGHGDPTHDVVDPTLSVLGVEGLSVADASVMPSLVGANTNATCAMIGEKAAQILLSSQKQQLRPTGVGLGACAGA